MHLCTWHAAQHAPTVRWRSGICSHVPLQLSHVTVVWQTCRPRMLVSTTPQVTRGCRVSTSGRHQLLPFSVPPARLEQSGKVAGRHRARPSRQTRDQPGLSSLGASASGACLTVIKQCEGQQQAGQRCISRAHRRRSQTDAARSTCEDGRVHQLLSAVMTARQLQSVSKASSTWVRKQRQHFCH